MKSQGPSHWGKLNRPLHMSVRCHRIWWENDFIPGLGLRRQVKAATENKDPLPVSGKGVSGLFFGEIFMHFCYLNVVE